MKQRYYILFLLFLLGIIISYLVYPIYEFERIRLEKTDNIIINDNRIILDSLTLRQKISQMIIIRGDETANMDMLKYNIGGIFLDKQKTKEDYKGLIKKYQDSTKIRLLVATDLEGAWNPFKNFINYTNFSNINSSEDAYILGEEHSRILNEIGFNINFAPVAEYEDLSYGGRVFLGTEDEVNDKLSNYIRGLQENIPGTCKHYPGKGMIKNLHKEPDKQDIEKKDLELFYTCMKNNISAIMIGHQIVSGELDSNNRPSSVSPEILSSLKNYPGLLISDEINMEGLSGSYSDKALLYADLINSGNNIIIDLQLDTKGLYDVLDGLEKLDEQGKLNITNIDNGVKKILERKAYAVI